MNWMSRKGKGIGKLKKPKLTDKLNAKEFQDPLWSRTWNFSLEKGTTGS